MVTLYNSTVLRDLVVDIIPQPQLMRTGYKVFSDWLSLLYTIDCSLLLGLGIRLGIRVSVSE